MMGNCLRKRLSSIKDAKSLSIDSNSCQTCTDHDAGINCLAITKDARRCVTGSDDSTARIWTMDDDHGSTDGGSNRYACRHVLRGHTDYIRCVSMESDHVLTGSADGTVRKWNAMTGECVHIYEGHKLAITRMLVTDRYVFTSSIDTTAKCWQFDTTRAKLDESTDEHFCAKTFRGHEKAVFPLLYIPKKCVKYGGMERQNSYPMYPMVDEREEELRRRSVGERLVTGSADCTARMWSIDDGRCLIRFVGHTGSVQCLSVDQYGQVLFTGSADRTIRSWDLERGGAALRVFEGHEKEVLSLLTLNRLLCSASADGTIKLWIVDFGDCARTLKPSQGQMTTGIGCMVYDNSYIFAGCGDSTARMYDVATGSIKHTFKGHSGAINCVKISQGKLFTGSADGTMRIWDLNCLHDGK